MSINISLPEAETRDHRLGTVITYHGTASDLVSKSKGRELNNRSRCYSQCSDCAQGCAETTTYLIKGAATVVHSPIGCLNPITANIGGEIVTKARGLEPQKANVICTNISEEDTVYGGARKIREAVLEAYDRFHPTTIFVHSSCAAGIIGDDIESEADELQEELGIPVVPVYCEGFKSKTWASGFDAAYHGILRKIVQPPRKKDPDLVNVFNFQGVDTFSRILNKLGLKANYLVPLASVDTIRYMSEAVCSTHICETLGTYAAQVLEDEYDVPQLRAPSPYGVPWTDEWIRELGKLTGRSELAEKVIEEEHARIQPELDELKARLKGKKAYVMAGDTFAHNLANLARELGMELVGITTLHHDQLTDSGDDRMNSLKKLVDTGGDVETFNVCNKQPYQTIKLLLQTKPDILITRHYNITVMGTKLGIPSVNEGDANISIGYDGIISFGRRVLEVLRSNKLLENIKEHNKFPYTQWWMDQDDPYYFEEEN